MTFQLDPDRAYRYTTIALVLVEFSRAVWWTMRRALTGDRIAAETERLRLQINRLQQTVPPPVEPPPPPG